MSKREMPSAIRKILAQVKDNKISVTRAEKLLKLDPVSVLDDIARLDLNRFARRGVPEIVFCKGKSIDQIERILFRLLSANAAFESPLILSKLSEAQFEWLGSKKFRTRILKSNPDARIHLFENAKIASIRRKKPLKMHQFAPRGRVALLCAGTSDISALDETEVVLKLLDCDTIRYNDIGVAFLKRLHDPLVALNKFDPDAIVVAAGMEAALPAVVAGLSNVPIIGLPTSVGYGYGKEGESALMSMLQACPLGVTVVNIDGGVPAGIIAWLIAKRCASTRT